MENREWQCFSLLSIFFPLSSFHSFLLARMEFYFLWNATDLRMSLFFGMLIRFTINNLVKSRQYFARMSIWNSLRWFAMGAFFPCNWSTTAFFFFSNIWYWLWHDVISDQTTWNIVTFNDRSNYFLPIRYPEPSHGKPASWSRFVKNFQ